jgi:UDP-3-O-[3-hydroxymyristoyl] glucosamine N-acyltransferase
VPARVSIGRNCRIDPGVTEADFGRRQVIRSGVTVTTAG